VKGKKMGYTSIRFRAPTAGEPGGLVEDLSARLRVGAGGNTSDVDLDEERFYDRAPPYRLVEIRSRERSRDSVVEHRYQRDGDQLVVTQTVDGVVQPQRRIAGSAETAVSVLDHLAVEPGEVKPGM